MHLSSKCYELGDQKQLWNVLLFFIYSLVTLFSFLLMIASYIQIYSYWFDNCWNKILAFSVELCYLLKTNLYIYSLLIYISYFLYKSDHLYWNWSVDCFDVQLFVWKWNSIWSSMPCGYC
jgi:nucleoside recognition membrane protein YjiH